MSERAVLLLMHSQGAEAAVSVAAHWHLHQGH